MDILSFNNNTADPAAFLYKYMNSNDSNTLKDDRMNVYILTRFNGLIK